MSPGSATSQGEPPGSPVLRARRHRNGTNCVFRRGGTWAFRIQVKGRRIKRGGFPTKSLAELARDAERRSRLEGYFERAYGITPPPRGPAPTLADYVREAYLPGDVARREPASQVQLRSRCARLVRHLGRYRLNDLTHDLLDRYDLDRRAEGVNATTVWNECATLAAILNRARRAGLIHRHPMHGWRRPRREERDYHVITPAEERAILAAAVPAFRPWIRLGLVTGLRKGELRLLERSALRLDHREIRVRQSKTGRWKRVPVSPRTLRWLRPLATGAGYVLPDGHGQPRPGWWVNQEWTRALKTAALAGIRFHDLRHTFATRLMEASRGNIPVVGECLGHRPPYKMTMRYLHALEETKRAAILRLDGADPTSTQRRLGHGKGGA